VEARSHYPSKGAIILYSLPDCPEGQQVERWFRDAGVSYGFVPVSGIPPEVTRGAMRLQTMDEIKNFIDSFQ
jgi:arsenate reductase-like glutaredoxin family protein